MKKDGRGKLHLILFSRAPVAGKTKSRLAAQIGEAQAAEFHSACLVELIRTLGEFRAGLQAGSPGEYAEICCHLFITPPRSEPDFAQAGVVWPDYFTVHGQSGGTLGERMALAFETVLGGEGAAGTAPAGHRALLLGSDLPLLTPEHLTEATKALRTSEVVLGPTEDGGYYLIGLTRPHQALFDIPNWGGTEVLRATITQAASLGLSVATVATLPDGDTLADLVRIRAHQGFVQVADGRAGRAILHLLENLARG